MTTVYDVYKFIDSFAPFDTKAEWDNGGILVGSSATEVSAVVVSLDITEHEISTAVNEGAQLIVSHHPVIFRPQRNFLEGSVGYELAVHGIHGVSAHTNLDKAPGGVNDVLCDVIGMKYEKLPQSAGEGFLNTGVLSDSMTCEEFSRYLSSVLGGAVRYNDTGNMIGKIGVCSGAGGDLAQEAAQYGCNAFVTGDASYHDFMDAADAGVALFAAGHFETENLIIPALIKKLSERFPEVRFIASDRKCPVRTTYTDR